MTFKLVDILLEAYDDASVEYLKSMPKLDSYKKFDDRKVDGEFTYLHFNEDDDTWYKWGVVKVFNNRDGTEIANSSYGKEFAGDELKASIDVRSDFRRKRIATKIYDWIEELNGERLYPDNPGEMARKFWNNRNKEKGYD